MPALCALAASAPFGIAPISGDTYLAAIARPLLIVQLVIGLVILITGWRRNRTVAIALVPGTLRWSAALLVLMVWLSAVLSDEKLIGMAGAATVTAVVVTVLATALVVRTSDHAARIIRALVGGVFVAAMIGLVVLAAGRDLWLTDLFRGRVTRLGLQPRLTRPWAHANVAGMAIGTAVVLSLGLLSSKRRTVDHAALRRLETLGSGRSAIPLALILAITLTLTYSRGALSATVVAALIGALVVRSWAAFASLGLLLGVFALMVSVAPGWTGRSGSDVAALDFAATVEPPEAIELGSDGATVPVTLTNNSSRAWPASGPDMVQLSARWLDAEDLIIEEHLWPLENDVLPDQQVLVVVAVPATVPDGTYRVLWDLLLDREAYFVQFSGRSAESVASVEQSPAVESVGTPLVPPRINLGRAEIWRIGREAFFEDPLLGVGPLQLGRSVAGELEESRRFPGAHAHNLVLEPLATWGLLGTAPFLLLIAGAVFRAGRWTVSVERSGSRGRAGIALSVLLGLVVICLHSAVEWPINQVGMALPFSLLLGIAWSGAADDQP